MNFSCRFSPLIHYAMLFITLLRCYYAMRHFTGSSSISAGAIIIIYIDAAMFERFQC